MSDENRFFRFLWRLNAILVSLVCVSVVIIVAVAVFNKFVGPRWQEPLPVSYFAPVPKGAEQKYTYRIEGGYYATELMVLANANSNEQLFPLRRWQGKPAEHGFAENPYGLQDIGGSSSIVTSREPGVLTVNLLSVETNTGASHWLLPGYERSIASTDAIYGTAPLNGAIDRTTPAVASIIMVYDADSNKDGQYTAADQPTLYMYRAGDAMATKLLTTDAIVTAHQVGSTYLVIYEKGKSAFAATYSIPEFKLLSQKPLPTVTK
jgi:hypothetical protein